MNAAVLDDELAALPGLPRADLVARWKAAYGTKPPKGISLQLMVRAIAYEIQAAHYGRLNPKTLRRLHKTNEGSPKERRISDRPRRQLQPGSRLIREWNGETHVVEVLDRGVIWNDKHYRSLSAVARAMTGARWSGPRFFGLTRSDAP